MSQYINNLLIFYMLEQITKEKAVTGSAGEFLLSGILNRGLVDSLWLSTWIWHVVELSVHNVTQSPLPVLIDHNKDKRGK